MYNAPDFVKVSVKAKDIFSGYDTHCPMDEYKLENNTIPCGPDDPNYTISLDTYVGMGWAATCYSTRDP